jgi:acyl transferase domain-containing protein
LTTPFYVNTRPVGPLPACGVRRAGVSAFGFGGTNFHAVLEEHVPGRLRSDGKRRASVRVPVAGHGAAAVSELKPPPRGALVLGAASENELRARLRVVQADAAAGRAPALVPPRREDLRAEWRLALHYETAADLTEKATKALKALESQDPATWRALRALGIFRGRGAAPKVAFLYTGQGSQYVNMLRTLRNDEPSYAGFRRGRPRAMAPARPSLSGTSSWIRPMPTPWPRRTRT